MEQHTVKIGLFSKKDLETKEGKRMSKTLCRLARPRAVASWNNPNPDTERARIMRKLDTVPASNDDRILTAFEDAGSKAIQLHELLLRLVEMTNKPSKRHLQAKIIGFDRRMRKGKFADLGFIQEAFLMGVEVGADEEIKAIRKQTTDDAQTKNNIRAIYKVKNGAKPYPGRDPICKESKMKEYCARMWHLLNRKHKPMTRQEDAALEIINIYQYRGTWQTLATHYRGYPPQELKEAWENLQKRGGNAE